MTCHRDRVRHEGPDHDGVAGARDHFVIGRRIDHRRRRELDRDRIADRRARRVEHGDQYQKEACHR